jgi:hypothetical protein
MAENTHHPPTEPAAAHKKARHDDSDEESPEAEVLGWRMDPAKSFSDWTIEIVSKPGDETTKVDTYHCHKTTLAVGPRRSDYFAHLLQNGDRFAEGQSNTSRIELEALDAEAFPELLDFMYNQNSSLAVNSENAVALHSLGQYFGIRHLNWEVRQFWTSDLNILNSGTSYEHARMFQDDKLLASIIKMCAENILEIPQTSSLIKVTNADFWLGVLHHETRTRDAAVSRHMSKLIIEFCHRQSSETLDAQAFLALTDAEVLPEIDVQVALDAIKLEQIFTEPAATATAPNLTSLQDRCLKELAVHWKTFSTAAETLAFLQTQNSQLVTTLLERLVVTAKLDNARTEEALGQCHKTITDYRSFHFGGPAAPSESRGLFPPGAPVMPNPSRTERGLFGAPTAQSDRGGFQFGGPAALRPPSPESGGFNFGGPAPSESGDFRSHLVPFGSRPFGASGAPGRW